MIEPGLFAEKFVSPDQAMDVFAFVQGSDKQDIRAVDSLASQKSGDFRPFESFDAMVDSRIDDENSFRFNPKSFDDSFFKEIRIAKDRRSIFYPPVIEIQQAPADQRRI